MSHSSSSSKPPVTRPGSCLCKAIKYVATGEPFSYFICHCFNCRKATGAAFMANAFFNEENVRVTEGEDKLAIFVDPETDRGIPLNRYFCRQCGSNIFLQSADPVSNGVRIKAIATGTLDEDPKWEPRKERWPEKKRHFIKGIKLRAKL